MPKQFIYLGCVLSLVFIMTSPVFGQELAGKWSGRFVTDTRKISLSYELDLVHKSGNVYTGIARTKYKGVFAITSMQANVETLVQVVRRGMTLDITELRILTEKRYQDQPWCLKRIQLKAEVSRQGDTSYGGEYYNRCTIVEQLGGTASLSKENQVSDEAVVQRLKAFLEPDARIVAATFTPTLFQTPALTLGQVKIHVKNNSSSETKSYVHLRYNGKPDIVEIGPRQTAKYHVAILSKGETDSILFPITIKGNLYTDTVFFTAALTSVDEYSPGHINDSTILAVPVQRFFPDTSGHLHFSAGYLNTRKLILDSVYQGTWAGEQAAGKKLEALIAQKDTLADCWKAIFLRYGYAGFPANRTEGYAIARKHHKKITALAARGDMEALLLFAVFGHMGVGKLHETSLVPRIWPIVSREGQHIGRFHHGLYLSDIGDYRYAKSIFALAAMGNIKKAAGPLAYLMQKDREPEIFGRNQRQWNEDGIKYADPYAILLKLKQLNAERKLDEAINMASAYTKLKIPECMTWLAVVYASRQNNVTGAMELLQQAAALHSPEALYTLACFYDGRMNTPNWPLNHEKAVAYAKKAAEMGLPDAMFLLAEYYGNGTHDLAKSDLQSAYWKLAGMDYVGSLYWLPEKNNAVVDFDFIDEVFSASTITITYNTMDGTVEDISDNSLDPVNFLGNLAKRYLRAVNQPEVEVEQGFKQVSEKPATYIGSVSGGFTADITVKKGQRITLRCWNKYYNDRSDPTPDGNLLSISADWPYLRQQLPKGTFQFKTGNGNWVTAGSEYTGIADATGSITFSVNGYTKNQVQYIFELMVE